MEPAEILARAKRINLPQKRFAALAGLDKMTVARTLSGATDPRRSTLRKLEAALLEEERRQLVHLRALHPEPMEAAE